MNDTNRIWIELAARSLKARAAERDEARRWARRLYLELQEKQRHYDWLLEQYETVQHQYEMVMGWYKNSASDTAAILKRLDEIKTSENYG